MEKSVVVRDAWLDWCRLFAISAVVLTHCVEQFYPLSVITPLPFVEKLPALILFTVGRLGVPVFLFLSGYLIPSRHEIKCAADYCKFIKRKWLPLFICAELWVGIYGVTFLIGSDDVHWHDVIRWMLFNRSVPLSHWWYVPMILGAYLGMPLLSALRNAFGRSSILWLFAASVFTHVFRRVVHIGFIDLSFVGDCYFTYIIFGYLACLYTEVVSHCMDKRLVRIGIGCLLGMNIVACLYYQIRGGRMVFIWYSSPGLITAGLMVPLVLKTLSNCRCTLVSFVSVASFGIYLLHNLILKSLHGLLFGIAEGWLRCALSWGIAMGVSVTVVAVVRRIPTCSRILFLIK